MFSSDLTNELGGRYVEFKIYSLSYMEFLDFHKLNNDDESLKKYNRFGGLPYLIHLPMREEVFFVILLLAIIYAIQLFWNN